MNEAMCPERRGNDQRGVCPDYDGAAGVAGVNGRSEVAADGTAETGKMLKDGKPGRTLRGEGEGQAEACARTLCWNSANWARAWCRQGGIVELRYFVDTKKVQDLELLLDHCINLQGFFGNGRGVVETWRFGCGRAGQRRTALRPGSWLSRRGMCLRRRRRTGESKSYDRATPSFFRVASCTFPAHLCMRFMVSALVGMLLFYQNWLMALGFRRGWSTA